MKHYHPAGFAGDRSLGLFQQEGRAGPDAALGRPRHHRNADAPRQRRLRADDRRRSRRGKRVSLDPRAQGRGAARRRPDRRPVHPRLRRRPRRAPPDRSGGDRERRARRRAGSPHPRRAAAPELPRLPCRPLFRLQRRGQLGLSLPRPDRGAEAARGHHHLRTRHLGRAVRQGRLQLRLDAADRSGRHRARDDRLSRRAGRSHDHPQARKYPAPASRCRRGCISAPWGWRRRRPISSARSRRATPAAISTTGGSARARGCIIRWRCRAPSSRSAIRTPRRATANSAAPRSRPR